MSIIIEKCQNANISKGLHNTMKLSGAPQKICLERYSHKPAKIGSDCFLPGLKWLENMS